MKLKELLSVLEVNTWVRLGADDTYSSYQRAIDLKDSEYLDREIFSITPKSNGPYEPTTWLRIILGV